MADAPGSTPFEPAYEYDLIVIGGGPAGEKGAAQAAYFGHKTVLVESYPSLGGACINWGTLASKTLRESALFLSGFRTRQLGEGMKVDFHADVTLANFMARTRHVQERERERAARNLAAPWHHIERVHGAARLIDPHTVAVRPADTGDDERRLTGRFILVATGSVPARPKEVPFNDYNVFDSTTILDMKRLPRSLVVVGGGVIGSEYVCLFQALGVQTTLVNQRPRPMESFLDGEICDAFTGHLRDMGVALHMNDNFAACTADRDRVRVTLAGGRVVEADALLYTSGRRANTKDLGLEALGIPVGRWVERVDPVTYQTVIPSVYAAGDVVGAPGLASTSMEQGRLAMCHAFGLKYKTRLTPILPSGIYTIPEISMVGKTEEDCRREGVPYVVGRTRFGQHARGLIIGDTQGMIKLIFEAPSGRLLGVHVIGELASELVHVGMACLHFEGGIDFFISTVFNYPTLGDAYKYAAYDALGKLNKVRDEVHRTAAELCRSAREPPPGAG
jgi:NAD(P) transhydrogenase